MTTPPRRDPVETYLAALGREEPPAGVVEHIMEAVRRTPRRRPVTRWVLAAAALVIVGVGAAAIWLGSTPLEPTRSPSPSNSTTSGPVTTAPSAARTTPQPSPSSHVLGSLSGTWQPIADAPIQGRQDHVAVWTGTEMIVWGGLPGPTKADDVRTSNGMEGAAYDPASGTWRSLAPASIVGRERPAAAWTGREMLVWGGTSWSGAPAGDGAAYDPVTDTWRHLPDAPFAPSGTQASVWARDRWILVDGSAAAGSMRLSAAAYLPDANRWEPLPGLDLPGRASFSVAWSDDQVVLFATAFGGRAVGFHIDPGSVEPPPAWQPIAEPPLLRLNVEGPELFTGTEVLVSSFVQGGGDRVVAYDVARDSWRSASPPPLGLGGGSNTWTGTLAVFGLGTGGMDRRTIYDPTRDGWLGAPDATAILRESATQVWTGDRLLLWGGFEGESFLRPANGFAFVPDARYATAEPEFEGSGNDLRVELVDASGSAADLRTPTRAEIGGVDTTQLSGDGTLLRQVDDRTVLFYWIGGPGDTAARLEIGADGRTIDLVAVPTYGDAMPFGRAIVVTFNHPVDAASLKLHLWNGAR